MDNTKINDLQEISLLEKRKYRLYRAKNITTIVCVVSSAVMLVSGFYAILSNDSSVFKYSFGSSIVSYMASVYFDDKAKKCDDKIKKIGSNIK